MDLARARRKGTKVTPSTNEWRLFSSSIFVFRLLDVDDERNANEYPLQVFKHRGKRLRCRVCDVYTARYLFKILLLQRNLCAVFFFQLFSWTRWRKSVDNCGKCALNSFKLPSLTAMSVLKTNEIIANFYSRFAW